jgi:hypothetical protein
VPRVHAAHQQSNVRRKVPEQACDDRPPGFRRVVSHIERDDRSPPEHRAADMHGDLVSKVDRKLPPHAFQQSQATLLSAMLPPTEQPDAAQGDPVQGTETTKPQQPNLGDDIHSAHPFLNSSSIGVPGGAAAVERPGV